MTPESALGARLKQNPRVLSNQRSTAYPMILPDAPEGPVSVDQARDAARSRSNSNNDTSQYKTKQNKNTTQFRQ